MDTYWRKLLEVCGAANVAARCRVVTPENAGRLPVSMSLTSKLLASPQAIRRIRMLCRGRQGYIVPGIVGEEEVRQCDTLKNICTQCASCMLAYAKVCLGVQEDTLLQRLGPRLEEAHNRVRAGKYTCSHCLCHVLTFTT